MKLTRRQFMQATGLSAIAAVLGLTAPREPTPEPEPQMEALQLEDSDTFRYPADGDDITINRDNTELLHSVATTQSASWITTSDSWKIRGADIGTIVFVDDVGRISQHAIGPAIGVVGKVVGDYGIITWHHEPSGCPS